MFRRRRASPRALITVLPIVGASAALFLIATVAVAIRYGGDPAAGSAGTVGPRLYSLIQPGQSRSEARALLGAPQRIQVLVDDGQALDCWVYRRARARAGQFRFCFRGGFVVKKSAI